MPTKLKHPLIENVDYIDIKKRGQLLKSYGSELNGKKWRQFQIVLGDEFGSGLFHYVYKQKNSDIISKGQISAVNKKGEVVNPDTGSADIAAVKQAIYEINSKLKETTKDSDFSTELLISVTKQSYEVQITFLNTELTRRDNLINKYESKIEALESELDSIEPGESNVMQYISIFKEIFKAKLGGGDVMTNLEASQPSDIPPEILQIIGMVDWQRVEPHAREEIIRLLNVFIQKLPMKGN